MSVQQNPASRQSFAVPPGLNRWLLLCQFDFRQKSWGLPAWEIGRAPDAVLPDDSGSLASAVAGHFSHHFPHFPSPSSGVATSRMVKRRIGRRHPFQHHLEKTKKIP